MKKAILFILMIAATACGSRAPKPDLNQRIDVAAILAQVNDAVVASIDPNDKDFPPLSSVQLDLEVSVTTELDGSVPISLLMVGGNTNSERLHHITLTFVPNSATPPAAPAKKPQPSKLATAIRAVYQSVAHAGSPYKFQNGSIVLQCTLKNEADLGTGSKGLGLVPVQLSASDTNQTIQTLTLNFGVAKTSQPPPPAPLSTPNS